MTDHNTSPPPLPRTSESADELYVQLADTRAKLASLERQLAFERDERDAAEKLREEALEVMRKHEALARDASERASRLEQEFRKTQPGDYRQRSARPAEPEPDAALMTMEERIAFVREHGAEAFRERLSASIDKHDAEREREQLRRVWRFGPPQSGAA